MKKLLSVLTIVLALNGSAFCSCNEEKSYLENQLEQVSKEIESIKTNLKDSSRELRLRLIKTNIEYLEAKVARKLKKTETRLERYKQELVGSPEQDEIEYLQKRIASAEKKIKHFNEVLVMIALLKSHF